MKQFSVFVQKEFYHILRDKWTVAILLLLPIIMLILFGYAITTEVRNSRVVVYDPSRDAATQNIIARLDASEYFSVEETVNDPQKLEQYFREGTAALAIAFSERFYQHMMHTGEAQIELIADGSDPNNAVTVINYATQIILAYQQELFRTNAVPYQIRPEIKLLYNPQMKGAYNFVPGVMGMIMILICAMMTSVSIAREKELGTMEILLVSPMQPLMIILAKAVPYFVISVVNVTNILLFAVFIMNVPLAGSLFWLIVLSLIYIFLSLALGLLISSVVNKQLIALLISGAGLIMPIMLLSGMIFPVENMPLPLQIISNVIPARWFIVAVKKLMIKGLGFSSITKELLILSSMALFFIIVSLKKFKMRLE